MAQLNFNATSVEPAQPQDAIPAGTYLVHMTESEMKPNSKGTGSFLSCIYVILEGDYKGRKLFDRLNLNNQNPAAVEIAYRTLSAICHATGVIQVNDSAELHNRPLLVKVSLRAAQTAAQSQDGKDHDASNEIKGYSVVKAPTAPQAPTFAAPQQFPPQGAAAPVSTWAPAQPVAQAPQAWQQPAPAAPVYQAPPVQQAPAPVQQPWAQAPQQQVAPVQQPAYQAPEGQPAWAAVPAPQAPVAQQAPVQQAPAMPAAGLTPPWAVPAAQ